MRQPQRQFYSISYLILISRLSNIRFLLEFFLLENEPQKAQNFKKMLRKFLASIA